MSPPVVDNEHGLAVVQNPDPAKVLLAHRVRNEPTR
jgi:hypothetical protein